MDVVRSGDEFQLTAKFYGFDGTLQVPTSIHYSTFVSKGGAILRPSLEITPSANTVTIAVLQKDTTKQDATLKEEEHTVQVVANFGTDTDDNPLTKTEEYHFLVK